jgi:hypothetical protein
LLLLLPILSYANIGKITVLKGDVTIKRGNDTITAKAGTTLEKHDFIKTDRKGKVQIIFADKTIFTIGKNSTLDIAEFLYDEAAPKKNKAKFNVLKGSFSSITGRIGKLNKSKFKLKTKSASIGIRGTIVKADQENIMCTEGAITVTTTNGIIMDVEAGQKTNVSTGVPTPPEEIQEGDEAAMGADITEEDKQESEKQAVEQEAAEPAKAEDVAAEVQNIAPEPKIVSLNGRVVKSDGTQSTTNINNVTIDNDILVISKNNENYRLLDDQGNQILGSQNTDLVWGDVIDDTSSKWVAGQQTSTDVIDKMRNSTTTVSSQYTGKVLGTVNNTDAIKMDDTNKVEMNFALGGGTNTVDGSIGFETDSGQKWNSTIAGSTSGNGFSIVDNTEDLLNTGRDSITGTTTNTDGTSAAITSGTVDGNFYGKNAESIGGTVQLKTGTDTMTGVFKADK